MMLLLNDDESDREKNRLTIEMMSTANIVDEREREREREREIVRQRCREHVLRSCSVMLRGSI